VKVFRELRGGKVNLYRELRVLQVKVFRELPPKVKVLRELICG
jgi:hypothetical protein